MADTQQQQQEPWIGASPAIINGEGDCNEIKDSFETSTTAYEQQQQHKQQQHQEDEEFTTSTAAYFFGKELSLAATAEMMAVSASLAATTDLALDAAADCDAVLDLQESFVSCIEGVNLQHDYDLEQDYTRDYYPNNNPTCSGGATADSPTSAAEISSFLTASEAALILKQAMEEQGKNGNNNNNNDDNSSDSNANIIHRPLANPFSGSVRDLDDDSDETMEEPLPLPCAQVAMNVDDQTPTTLPLATVSRTRSSVASLSSSRNSSPTPPGAVLVPESSSSSSSPSSIRSQNVTSEQETTGPTYDGMSSLYISRAYEDADETATDRCHVCIKPTHYDDEQDAATAEEQLHVQGLLANDSQTQESSSSSSEFPLTADMTGCFIL